MEKSVREFSPNEKEKSRDRDWTGKKNSECALVRSKSQKLALGSAKFVGEENRRREGRGSLVKILPLF